MANEIEVNPPPSPLGDDQPERHRRRLIANPAFGALKAQHNAERTMTEAVADELNAVSASPAYLILHVIWFAVWIPWNLGWFGLRPFDPYPFILLNLFLSMLASIQAPVIMMSQNRQDAKDRLRSQMDFQVNRRAELEIRGLGKKLNELQDKIDDVEELLRKHSRGGA